jgi:uncharacterized protein (DUF1697 family)
VTRQVALLRGINVGGHRGIGMSRLREAVAEAGYTDVETYLRSGNVVFTSQERSPDVAARDIAAAIETAFGADVTVLVRDRDDLAAVIEANPMPEAAAEDPAKYFVVFLAAPPTSSALVDLDQARYAPDEFRVAGRHLYLWCPNGAGRTKLTNAFLEKKAGVAATSRNWRTVLTLLAMADDESPHRQPSNRSR